MKKIEGTILLTILFILLSHPLFASTPYNIDARLDRIEQSLARIEATLKTFMELTNKRFEDINKRFEDMNKRFEDMNKRFEALQREMNARFEVLQREMDKRFAMVDKRFEDMNKRFDQMFTFLWILTGIFTTLTLGVIGFAYWDRRTIIRKAREETRDDIEKEGRVRDLILAMRELAKKNKDVAYVLRNFNLM